MPVAEACHGERHYFAMTRERKVYIRPEVLRFTGESTVVYHLETMELTLDKLDWAEELHVDQDYVDLMRASGGQSSDVHFHVVYNNAGPRTDPEVVGYLTTISDKEGKESLSLYRGADGAEEYGKTGSRISVVDGDKVFLYDRGESTNPVSSFKTGSGSVYLPDPSAELAGELYQIDHEEKDTARTLSQELGELGADAGYQEALSSFYGIEGETALMRLDKEKGKLFDCWPEYMDLMKNDKEYRMLNLGNYVGGFAEGVLEGSLTGLIFEQGALYKMAGFTGIMAKFSPKVLKMISAPVWGKKVDDASEGTDSLEKLRKVERYREALFSNAHAAALVAIQPAILGPIASVTPGGAAVAFGGIFIAEELTGGIKDAGGHKTSVAIRREILSKYEDQGYDKRLFELIGLEEAVEGGVHMAGFGVGLAASIMAKEVVFPLSLAAMGMYFVGKTMWTCYSHKPDMRLDIMSDDFIHTAEGLKFDNGYVLDFASYSDEAGFAPMDKDVRIGRNPELGASFATIEKTEGDWGVIIKEPETVTDEGVRYKEKFWNKSFLPKLMGSRTVKETWDVNKDILLSRHGGEDNVGYMEMDDGTVVFGTEGFRKAVEEKGVPTYREQLEKELAR